MAHGALASPDHVSSIEVKLACADYHWVDVESPLAAARWMFALPLHLDIRLLICRHPGDRLSRSTGTVARGSSSRFPCVLAAPSRQHPFSKPGPLELRDSARGMCICSFPGRRRGIDPSARLTKATPADACNSSSRVIRCFRLRPIPLTRSARLAYLTGRRREEVVSLRCWDAVDRSAREVRLRTSRTAKDRVLPLDGELLDLMERRWSARTVKRKDSTTKISAFVFHRSGEPVVDFRKPWNEAFVAAEGAPPDLSRSAPDGRSQHDPGWGAPVSGHEHQRTQDRQHVPPLQHLKRSGQTRRA